MLLSLLPLAGWAATNVTVYPMDIDKTYGTADPTVDKSMFTASDNTLTDEVLEKIAEKLAISRVQSGETVNGTGYSYRLTRTASSVEVNSETYNIYVSGTATLYINPLNFGSLPAGATLKVELNETAHVNLDGSAIKPAIGDFKVTISGLGVPSLNGALTASSDYTLDASGYGANNTKGETAGSLKITGAGDNFTGTSDALTFPIKGISLVGATVTYVGTTTGANLTFKNAAWEPVAADFTLRLAGASTDLAASGNWEIKTDAYGSGKTYKDNTNAGKGKVTIKAVEAGNYDDEVEAEFTIAPFEVAVGGLTITKGADPTFNGKVQAAAISSVSITAKTGWPVTEDDYEVTPDAETWKAGDGYTSTVKFKEGGNYTGTPQKVTYSIAKMAMTAITKTVTTTDIEYTGKAITPEYTLKVSADADAYVLEASDYEVVETNNTKANNAATIQFKAKEGGNFTGETVADTYTIAPAELTVTPNDITASYGSSIIPSVTVTGWKTDADEAKGYEGAPTYKYTGTGSTSYAESATAPTAVGTYSITPAIVDGSSTPLLTAENYTFVINSEKTTASLTIAASELLLEVVGQTKKYGETPAAFSLKYKSGLPAGEVSSFNPSSVENVAYEVWQGDTKKTYSALSELNTLDKGTYTIKAVATPGNTITYSNYSVIIIDGTLTIKQRPISDATITISSSTTADFTGVFNGKEQKPGYTVQLNSTDVSNTENANYTVAYGNNVNATKDAEAYYNTMPTTTTAQKNAKAEYQRNNIAKVVFTAAADGNFSGSVEKFFTIDKKNLNVTAAPGTWQYGTEEATAKASWTASIATADLVDDDKSLNLSNASSMTTHKFTGALTVSRTAATGDNVGEYYDDTPSDVASKVGLIPSGLSATNYKMVYHVGKLTITKGEITLKAKDYEEKYGNTYNTSNFELEYVSGLSETKAAGWKSLISGTITYKAVSVDAEGNVTEISEANVPKAVDGTVKLLASGATATNYDIKYDYGTYTVVKRPLAFKLTDQTINYGEDITRTDEKISLRNTEAGVYDATDNSFKDGDTFAKLIESGAITFVIAGGAENEATGVATANAIQATLTHANYVLDTDNCQWGSLTVNTTDPLELVYAADEDNDAKIKELADASGITVKLTRNIPVGYEEKWFAMVLPFDATLTELCTAFDQYVVVNTLDKTNTDASKVNFKLQMKQISANEPFLIKFSKAVTGTETTPIQFTARTIAYSATPETHDVAGNYFYGTFKQKALNADKIEAVGNKIWTVSPAKDKFVRLGAKTTTLNPLLGWLETADELDQFAPAIFVQDIDGTVTAINGIVAETPAVSGEGWYNLNGVKLDGAPTEKGVYIQNGKKVVVK